MLQMIKGARVNGTNRLFQNYMLSENQITANVDADNILKVIGNFIDMNPDEYFFLFIEVPANLSDEPVTEEGHIETLHKDLYYLDGISADAARQMIDAYSEILVNDGLSAFGIGKQNGEEIGKYKYNTMILYSPEDPMKYRSIFEKEKIVRTDMLVSAWTLISPSNPGECRRYTDSSGHNIYDVVEKLTSLGLYKAETRED